jgi:hypothetical protein
MVVSSNVPRYAIVAYFNERSERELIIEWRKARNLRIVNGEQLAVRETAATVET